MSPPRAFIAPPWLLTEWKLKAGKEAGRLESSELRGDTEYANPKYPLRLYGRTVAKVLVSALTAESEPNGEAKVGWESADGSFHVYAQILLNNRAYWQANSFAKWPGFAGGTDERFSKAFTPFVPFLGAIWLSCDVDTREGETVLTWGFWQNPPPQWGGSPFYSTTLSVPLEWTSGPWPTLYPIVGVRANEKEEPNSPSVAEWWSAPQPVSTIVAGSAATGRVASSQSARGRVAGGVVAGKRSGGGSS